MIYAGVDPGKAGAIVILDDAGHVVEVIATPMIKGSGSREEYDLPAIAAILRQRTDPRLADRGMFVAVERLHPMPLKKGGTIANYNRGVAFFWLAMLAAFRIPHLAVLPQAWQRATFAGLPGKDPKAKSILAAKRTWPGLSLRRTPRSKTDDDGIADAANIAEFGRKARLGGAVFAQAARA